MVSLQTNDPVSVFIAIFAFMAVIGVVISIHEAAHAFVANLRGDPTARLLGRMSLNPLVHIDPLGTVIVPLILFMLNAPVFGWAKPTPVNPFNFANPRRDSALVSFAGPASNLILAILLSGIYRVTQINFLLSIIALNLVLAIFNLIPVPPLDGYKIILGVLPRDLALKFSAVESMGPIFLLVVLFILIQIFSNFILFSLGFLMNILTGVSPF